MSSPANRSGRIYEMPAKGHKEAPTGIEPVDEFGHLPQWRNTLKCREKAAPRAVNAGAMAPN